jgi:protein dithiol oxidoreductase (disulfide-forming)
MKLSLSRRDLGSLSFGAAAALAGLQATPLLAQGKPPEEGLDYVRLDKPAPTEAAKGKVEVVEFFWYGCPHCNAFEPQLEAWLAKLPKDVHFRRSPAAFRPEWVPQQHLYFTLLSLGLVEQLHKKIFYAIHVEKLNLDTKDQIMAWIPKQAIKGLDMAKFTQTFDSFATASKVTQATQLQQSYRIDGVPALGVAGQFLTDGGKAQGMVRALSIVDALVNGQRKKK